MVNIEDNLKLPEPAPVPRQSSKRILMPAALAVVLGAGSLMFFGNKEITGKSVDLISPAAESAREAAFAGLKPVTFIKLKSEEIPSAIASMGLNQTDQAALLQASTQGTKLISIALYDSDAEDGDAVTITSDGFSRTVVLQKQITALVIPEPKSGFFTLTGARDGEGGGVTVGMVLPSGPFPFPIMSVGQTLTIPTAAPGIP